MTLEPCRNGASARRCKRQRHQPGDSPRERGLPTSGAGGYDDVDMMVSINEDDGATATQMDWPRAWVTVAGSHGPLDKTPARGGV